MTSPSTPSSFKIRVMHVLWPSFLVAIAAEGLFFSLFDPDDLLAFGHPLEVSRLGAYTIGFFAFWLVAAASGALTCFLVASHVDTGSDGNADETNA